jgi:hypothetical protein
MIDDRNAPINQKSCCVLLAVRRVVQMLAVSEEWAFRSMRASCHACAHKCNSPNVIMPQSRLGYTVLPSLEQQLRCLRIRRAQPGLA